MKIATFVLLLIVSLASANQFERLVDKFETTDTVKLYKPSVTTSLSIIPGGGQLYTRHITRGSIFLGMGMLMGTQSVMRWNWYHQSFNGRSFATNRYDSLVRTLPTLKNSRDSLLIISALHDKKKAEFETEKQRIDWVNWSGWFAGIYAWNLVDAIGCSNQFNGVENPSPKRATWLSAIPFSGAGQFYNGEFFKGAMFSTVQLGCMYSAINFQRVMNNAERIDDELSSMPDSAYLRLDFGTRQEWKSKAESARESRTMFMWYGVIFYLYGLADAAVDAHFHGFERRFQITPAVDPTEGKISLGINGNIGGNR